MILRCPTCAGRPAPDSASAQAFQNERYGAGRRVCNPTKEKGRYRCACCLAVVDAGAKDAPPGAAP